MRITKAALKVAKEKLSGRLKELANDLIVGVTTLEEMPNLELAHQRAFPHLTTMQRPAFAAAALNDLLQYELGKAFPDYWMD